MSTCNESDGLTDAEILDAALAPASITSDNQSVSERSASDLIDLDRYLRARKAACRAPGDPFAGLRFGLFIPPGTRGRQ